MKTIEKRKAEVTIRRPDGKIETLIHSKIDYFNDQILAQMRKAMNAAGRGEVLSYRNIEAIFEMEESDYQTNCERCRTGLDSRTAKSQKEWARFGGQKVRVTARYCDACWSLLSTIGAGEVTDLEHRAGHTPSYEPTTKEDF
jgi:hypothetical protein